MSNIPFEYYYLSGKDIPLNMYNLGVIKQLTLNDFIDKGIDMNEFIQPFVLNKKVILNKNENVDKILEDIKDLSFLFLYEQLTGHSIVKTLIKSLSVIYGTNNIHINKNRLSIIVESESNGTCIIDDDNFHFLATVVCEMSGIDKEDVPQVKPQAEMSDIEKEFERRRQKYLQMQKEKEPKKKEQSEGYTILDIANIVIHFSTFTYDEVFNLTIYQLKNSFKVLAKKDSYMVNLLHRISQKFDTSKEKFTHWTDEIKLDISSLSLKD